MDTNKPILTCTNLRKSYGSKIALNNINLQIGAGKIIGLLGSNGSGKSTILKLINGLLKPTAGDIIVDNFPIGINSKNVISYLPERSYLNDSMKVSEYIKFFKDFYNDFDEQKAYDMLKRLNLEPNARLKTMSKGTKEKVQLILVMSRNAKLYLLDEPIGGVDPAARDYILDTILKNYNENATVIISTHLIADIESILDEVIFISNGDIVLQSQVDTIREEKGMSVDALFREVFRC